MIRYIFNFIFLTVLILTSLGLAKGQDKPVIYQLFVREDVNIDGGQLAIIDPVTFTQLKKIVLSPSNPARIELTLDKKQAITINSVFSDRQKGIQIVNLSTGDVKSLFQGIGVYGLKVSPDGMIWALLNETEEIAIINSKDLSVVSRIKLEGPPRDIIFSPDNKDRRVYVSLLNSNVFVFDYVTKRSITAIRNLPKGDDSQVRPQELELSPDGKLLYIGSIDTISIADISISPIKITSSFTLPINNFGDFLLKASPDGKFLYIAEYLGGDLYIYDTQSKEVKNIRPPRESGILTSLNLSSNGKILYASGFYGVAILDTETNTLIKTILTS
ncbi:MAG: hypothetical protein FD167_847, partial [bacterium]